MTDVHTQKQGVYRLRAGDLEYNAMRRIEYYKSRLCFRNQAAGGI